MSLGPVELLLVTFPAGASKRDIVPALLELVDNGTIHIIDLIFVRKDDEGNLTIFELEQGDEDEAAFGDLEGEVGDLLTDEDIVAAAENLPPGGSAALLVWENVWAARFAQAVRAAGGEVALNLRIPSDAVEAALPQ
jgi:hypothetical protein